jgi:O-acetylserine/cysteine efflux transporter
MTNLKFSHLLAALGIIFIWGFNFVVIKVGLKEIPPIFLCFLRFILSALPAIFFFKRPNLPWHKIFQYGLVIFAMQFAFLFSGMYFGVSAGLAAVVLQVHVFVTIALATVFFNERPAVFQLLGAIVAFVGIATIAFNIGDDLTVLGFLFVLLAAVSWGVGNIIAKGFNGINVLALVVWGSLVAAPPLLLLSLVLEGPDRIAASLQHMSLLSAGAIAYLVYPTTLLGFAVWTWLMSRYPAASIAPLTLLVPIVGMASSALVLGEKLQDWKLLAALLVVGGLCASVLGPRNGALFKKSGTNSSK